MEESIRLVIVEDDEHLRNNLVDCLEGHGGFTIIGAFGDAESCIEQVNWDDVDILLLDLELPGMPGLELIERLRGAAVSTRVAVFTNHDDRRLVFQAIQMGALGYVLKGSSLDQISHQLKRLIEGEAPVSPSIAMMLLQALGPSAQGDHEPLSHRELELLNLLAQGLQYKEAGPQMGISEHTVHSHVKRIYSKLNVASRSQAVQKARLLGLVRGRSFG